MPHRRRYGSSRSYILSLLLGAAIALSIPFSGMGNRADAASGLGSLPETSSTSPLAGLPFARDGKIFHAGSWDRSGGNGDARPIAPGKSLTLLDYKGAGIVRRFWVTIAPEENPEINRGVVLRCYWDGEKTPSVEVPIGDFFGESFGKKQDYHSLPLEVTSGGLNCYWPMPFHKSARIVVDNESPVRVDAFYYNMEVETHRSLPKSMLDFHARWNRENPTRPRQNYTILQATGRGQYVGTLLEMTRHKGHGLGFLEGDEMVYVDGEQKPSINGTGTEDFFSSGWYFDRGPYSADYHGLIEKDEKLDRITAYRWQIEDAIPFQKSIRFTIEHGNQDDTMADYSSVAFWYQAEPHGPQPPLLPYAERLPDYTPPIVVNPISPIHTAILADDLSDLADASAGDVSIQDMASFKNGTWPGNAQLWWHPANGDTMTIRIPVKQAGDYDGTLLLTQAPDYGNIAITMNGQPVGDFNGYAKGVVSQKLAIGKLPLKAGDNMLVIKITGKDPASSNYLVGIGEVELKPA
ncbi:MAG TPA: glycoside hydrolase family 172 protein [Armatimonadota bacterium]|nr:glycoside hydrolase family 172 protein [Armatimonadota bacterium]